MKLPEYQALTLHLEDQVAYIEMNRPHKANAMNLALWREISLVFELAPQASCEGRRREQLRRLILDLQSAFSRIEKCRKPVIAAIQGGCIGAGVDMVSACDMRFCSVDAYLQIKEIDLGITADVGTLQRLPHIIGDGIMRELAYTGRRVDAEEAERIGLVNRVFDDKDRMREGVALLARQIAGKSPLATRGIKEMILYARDHSVADGLNYVATWNAAMLLSNDLQEIHAARAEKRAPRFED